LDAFLEAKVLIERSRQGYNTVRLHCSLDCRPPGTYANHPSPAASATLQIMAEVQNAEEAPA
jgi:hypothetical protein